MAISESDFTVSISPNPIGTVIGMSDLTLLSFENTSDSERGYNLSVEVTIPDGVSYVESSVIPTSIKNNADGTMLITWVNIKDLASKEIDFKLTLTLKSDELFRQTGKEVPFDIPLENVIVKGTIDTLPRGNFDIGNEKISKTHSINFIPLRYILKNSAPGKMPKGAGLISPEISPMWIYQYTLTVINNSTIESNTTLIDTLPNGVRYLGGLTVTGPDAEFLSNPTIITPTPNSHTQNFATLDWGNITLSNNSINTITFNVAIWDNYTFDYIENTGERIPHQAPLENIAILDGESGPVESSSTTKAMDAVINKNVATKVTDVNKTNNYTLSYKINQYDNVGSFIITDIISDGQNYNYDSASITPDSIETNPDGTTKLTWELGILSINTSGTITFSTIVNEKYHEENPVCARDILSNNVSIEGINQTTTTATPDNFSIIITIKQPTIIKELLNYYYKDGTIKNIQEASPGDTVEFKITYSSEGLIASQKEIEIDEYAPLNMGPLTEDIPITYDGNLPGPFTPITVSPNGLRWSLGTLPGNSLWSATFEIPVKDIDFIGFRNNIAKLAGENTTELGYSGRDQVSIDFGEPTIGIIKNINGPNINAAKVGEIYTYSITISNPQNTKNTVADAFEMDLTDTIPDGLTYTGNYTVTGDGLFNPPLFQGENISMLIKKIAPNEILTLNFDVIVNETLGSGETFINTAILQRPYSQPDRYYQYPGEPFAATAILKASKIQLTKIVAPQECKIGDIIQYTLEITVPKGTNAYNIQVSDVLPNDIQSFIVGSAEKDGESITPSVNNNTILFPSLSLVNAQSNAIVIIYTFHARIINASHIYPYIDSQLNTASINWTTDQAGTIDITTNNSAILKAQTPNLIVTKLQRNMTTSGNFTTANINYAIGDIIEYKLLIVNNGAEKAFNSVITDTLNKFLTFNEDSISTSAGTAHELNETITWNINLLAPSESVELTFNVTTLAGIATGTSISNNGLFLYSTNDNGFEVTYGPNSTNTLKLNVPNINITKASSINEGAIGNDITYTITAIIPNGTIAYTPLIEDELPIGQSYIGSGTRQAPPEPIQTITPTILNQKITFPINSDIDATHEEKTIIYTFVARITNINYIPPYEEIQKNTAKASWATTKDGSLVKQQTGRKNITVKVPHINILKQQRKASTGENFSTNSLSEISVGDIIEYKISLTNDGTNTAYNIITTDTLDSAFTYLELIGPVPSGTVEISNNIITWRETSLDTGASITLTFSVKINSILPSGKTMFNQTYTIFDTSTINPLTLGPELSNNVSLNIALPEISKTSDNNTFFIGDTITYTIQIVIPKGTIAYNVKVTDILSNNQSYIPNSLTRNRTSINPSPTLIFPSEGTINAEYIDITIIYTFQTVVDSINTSPEDMQINTAKINWDFEPEGSAGPTQSANKTIYATDSNIILSKAQKNFTTNNMGEFTTDDIYASVGDIIYYKLTVLNPSEINSIYNVNITDNLDIRIDYYDLITPPTAGEIVNLVESGNELVRWTIDSIHPLTSYNVVIGVKIKFNSGGNRFISNKTEAMFTATSESSSSVYGPTFSNSTNIILPLISSELFVLGQSEKGQIENVGEEIRLDIQLSENPNLLKASIVGTVTDIVGNPIKDAIVKILDSMDNPLYHTITDINGYYCISDVVSESELHVHAVKQGYLLSDSVSISLAPGQTDNINFILNIDPAASKSTIAGHVFDTDNNPLENLIVTLLKSGEETEIATSSTNEYGQYVFMNIDLGNYILRITGNGYKVNISEVLITEPGSIISLQNIMIIDPETSNGTINGIIKNSKGNPVNNAVVILYKVTGTTENPILTPIKYTRTIENGAYLFGEVPQGKYIVKSNKEE